MPLLLLLGLILMLPSPALAQTAAVAWRGLVTDQWGDPTANRCVPDVSAALRSLGPAGARHGFRLREGRAVRRFFAHWQGVQRLPVGDGRWLALSRSGAPVGFVLVQLGSQTPGGGRLTGGGAYLDDRPFREVAPPPEDGLVLEVPAPGGLTHGGGLQALGTILAVPFEDTRTQSLVAFYDLTDPGRPRLVHQFDHAGLSPPHHPGHASAAGLARLADGRVLLVTGERSSKVLEFHVSTGPDFEQPGFAFRTVAMLYGAVEGGFQNLNLITQCDGALFLVGTHNSAFPPPSLGSDWIRWYRLVPGARHAVALVHAGSRRLDCERCNFGAGAGLFVDPEGRPLLYAVEHGAGGAERSTALEEFRPHYRGPAHSLATAWADFYEGPEFGGRLLRVTAAGETGGSVRLPPSRSGQATSARWAVPTGWRLRLYADGSCSGRFLDLTGLGESDHLAVLEFNNQLACTRWISDDATGHAADPGQGRS